MRQRIPVTIFVTAEYPHFGSKHEYISTNVAIPLSPISVELATEINAPAGVPPRDQVTISVKYPLIPFIKAGTYMGDLRVDRGIRMSVGVPKVNGTISISLKEFFCDPQAELWVEFDLLVFGVGYKGKFPVLSFPSSGRFIDSESSNKPIAEKGAVVTTTLTSGLRETEASSVSGHDETKDTTYIVVPDAVAVAAAE